MLCLHFPQFFQQRQHPLSETLEKLKQSKINNNLAFTYISFDTLLMYIYLDHLYVFTYNNDYAIANLYLTLYLSNL